MAEKLRIQGGSMKKWLMLFSLWAAPLWAGNPVEFVAHSSGTTFTVVVTSNPAILITTGSFVADWTSRQTSTSPVTAQKLPYRYFLEIQNDSTQDIYVGHDLTVS